MWELIKDNTQSLVGAQMLISKPYIFFCKTVITFDLDLDDTTEETINCFNMP